MPELIDKNELYEKLEELGGCDAKEEYFRGWDDAITAAIEQLDEMPTAEPRELSKIISDFADLLREAGTSHQASLESMQYQDKIKQDILHKFELDELSPEERRLWDDRLDQCLRERRVHKDAVEELEPVYLFANENAQLQNKLKQLLGKVRKVESYHANRSYVPKVLKEGV